MTDQTAWSSPSLMICVFVSQSQQHRFFAHNNPGPRCFYSLLMQLHTSRYGSAHYSEFSWWHTQAICHFSGLIFGSQVSFTHYSYISFTGGVSGLLLNLKRLHWLNPACVLHTAYQIVSCHSNTTRTKVAASEIGSIKLKCLFKPVKVDLP